MANKVNLLNDYFVNNEFEVCCISEHWLNHAKLSKINLVDFTLISAFCRTDIAHGGVAIFAKNNVQLKPIDVNRFCVQQHAEFCGAEFKNAKCAIVTIYRSSSHGNLAVFKEKLSNLIDYLSAKYKYFVLIGDINLDLTSVTEHAKDVQNILTMYGSSYYICVPTRVTDTSSSCLDNVICNLPPDDIVVGVGDLLISDHSSVYIKLKNVRRLNSPQDPVVKRIFNNNNIDKFADYISHFDWSSVASLNADQLSKLLLEQLRTALDNCCPYKNISKRKSRLKWYNERLCYMRSELHKSKRAFDRSKSHGDWLLYTSLRKGYKHALKEEKYNYYANSISSSDNKSKTIWGIVNRELPPRSSSGSCTPSSYELNAFFTSVSEAVNKTIAVSNVDPHFFLNRAPSPSNSFYMAPVVETDVRQAILKMKNSASSDFYDFNSQIFKASADSLVLPLTLLFNKCVAEGNWPNDLKITKIIPIFKKGGEDLPDNYRPVAIGPIISKTFEIIMKERLVSYFDSKDIISPSQYGFRKNSSTVKALLSLICSIVDGLDEGLPTHAVLCDLTKAFDCVNIDLLLIKLHHYGIRGNVLKLLESYLTNRFQFVSFKGADSDLQQISCGVPQGSVLGPLLFLVYVNDLPPSLDKVDCILFADDTTILARGELQLNTGFQKAKVWFDTNRLKLNETKTNNILFSSDRWTNKSEPVRMLGVMLDTGLCWSAQVESLCAKLSTQIFVMRQLRPCLDNNTMRVVYFAMIHSLLSYAVVLWGNSVKSYKVFYLQKASVRIIDSSPRGTHCRPLFRRYGILPLPCVYILETLLLIHKNLNNLTSHGDRHNYGTRLRENLIPPYSRLRTTEVNKLDLNLYNKFCNMHSQKNVKSMKYTTFHKLAKDFLTKECFYSVREYLDFTAFT